MPEANGLHSYYAAALLHYGTRHDSKPIQVGDSIYLSMNGKIIGLKNLELIEDAIAELIEYNAGWLHKDPFGPDMFEFADKDCEDVSPSSDSPYAKTYRFGDDWISSAIAKINEQFDDQVAAEAADADGTDIWQPLPIDREDTKFEEVVVSVEEALQAIEGNNGYAESEPDERNGIVSSVQGMLSAIKQGSPSRSAIIEGLLKPLKFIAGKFSGAIMGELAKKAATLLTAWIFGG